MPLTDEHRRRGWKKFQAKMKATHMLLVSLREGGNPIAPIENMDESALRCKLTTYLKAVTGIGKKRHQEIVEKLHVDPSQRIGKLSHEQTEELLEMLRRYWNPGRVKRPHKERRQYKEVRNETPDQSRP